MAGKEFRVQYKKARGGFLWILLRPLLEMAIIGLIFSFFFDIPNYYLFLLAGLIPWTFFSQSVSRAAVSIVEERNLLLKSKFPIEAIPLSVVLVDLLNLLVSIFLLLIFLLIVGELVFVKLIFLIPALLLLIAFSSGISLLTSALYVKYRDIGYVVRALLILWFYATPIIYSLSLIPDKVRYLFSLNPLASTIELFRISLLDKGNIYGEILIVNLVITILVTLLGILVFRKNRNSFVDWL